MLFERFRHWIIAHLPLLAYAAAYFITVVLGNLIYTTGAAQDYLRQTDIPAEFLDFPETFSAGFWALLLLPFALVPLGAVLARRMAARPIATLAARVPEFSYPIFAVVSASVLAVVVYAYVEGGVYGLFTKGDGWYYSVMARFTILERLGFVTMTLLQACLPYLALYAIIKALLTRTVVWRATALALCVAISALLLMLNMKWPVLLFFVGIVLCIFTYTQDRPFLKGALGFVFLMIAYLLVTSFVLRAHGNDTAEAKITPALLKQHMASPAPATARPGKSDGLKKNADTPRAQQAVTLMRASFFLVVNRMAAGFPYYYHVFTTEGPVCGGLLDQASRTPPCRPSIYIYTKIFGDDGIGNKSTTPQGVHVISYALGGWKLALVGMLMTGVALGLFMALPREHYASVGAFYITGAVTGYHFSQISAEDALFYEHGLFWTVLLIAGMVLLQRGYHRFRA